MTEDVSKKTALIIVDMQVGFGPDGELPVGGAQDLVAIANELMATGAYDLIVATMDSHPPDHCSFKEQGGLWPAHCVSYTKSWQFLPGLDTQKNVDYVVCKGTDKSKEAYSGFDTTILEELLRKFGITDIEVMGLATDYCVKATALDAKRLGFEVQVLKFACRAVATVTAIEAIKEMEKVGIIIIER